MGFVKIFERELRLGARKPVTYYSRSVAAIFVLCLSLGMLFSGFAGLLSAASAGRSLFIVLAICAYFFLLFEGAILTADCLSSEKRDGTLGLLFLTDLGGFDVAAGKLAARTLNSAYCFLATVPAPGIAIFLGGVTGEDVLLLAVALLNVLFWASSLGLLVSALCVSERTATTISLLLVFGLGVALPAIGAGWTILSRGPGMALAISAFSPAAMILSIVGQTIPGLAGLSFANSWWTTNLAAWGFLLAASVLLPKFWQESISLSERLQHSFLQRKSRGGPAPWWMEGNPVFLAGRHRPARSRIMRLLCGILALLWFAGKQYYPGPWGSLPWLLGAALLLQIGLTIACGIESCRTGAAERAAGALELLLTTPLDEQSFVRGKLQQIKRRLAEPLLLVLAADAACVIAAFFLSPQEGASALVFCGFLFVQMLAHLQTLAWTGLKNGLRFPSASRAMRQTFFEVIGVHWLLFFAGVGLLALLSDGAIFRSPVGAIASAGWYLLLLGMIAAHHFGAARHELFEELKRLATR